MAAIGERPDPWIALVVLGALPRRHRPLGKLDNVVDGHADHREHDQHGEALQRILDLTANITPPSNACNTWRALYRGLDELRNDLMQHIHLENNLLFPRALGEEVQHG